MSDHLAIGGVSLTLKALLEDRMDFTLPSLMTTQKATITISAPDVTHGGITGPRLNIFLYHIAENIFLKNQEIPGQGHPGDYGHPPLSLVLFYLLTAYGRAEIDDVPAQQVLGDAMRVMHDFPLVTDSLVKERVGGGIPILDTSLIGEFEHVKITLDTASVDDLSKIWTTFPNTSYRCSVAYQVSVVQIESRRLRPPTLPVRERRVYALPFRGPQITEVFRDPPLNNIRSAIAAPGETLRIRGQNLYSTATRVMLRDQSATIGTLEDKELTVTVPATLQTGAHPVQVVHDVMLEVVDGQPPVAHRGYFSNTAVFLLIPAMTAINPPVTAAAGATVTVTVTPPVRATQEVFLLLGDFAVPAVPVAPNTPPRTNVDFKLPTAPAAIPAGTYLRRVRVDGAESRLTFDPVTGLYDGPTYNVT